MTADDERICRVASLRSDEVIHLNGEASNRTRSSCCPHLDVFHNDGQLAGGGTWRACTVRGCSCMEEKPSLWNAEGAEKRERAERWEALGFFLAGCAFGFVISIALVLL